MNKKQLQQLAWRWRGIMTAPIVILLVYIIRATGILQGWELAVFDHYMRSRPQPEPDNRIVIVGIDEKDVAEIGIDPFPDEIYAQLLEKLIAMNPKAIGLDIYRNVPVCNDPLGHDKLVNIFESYDNIIGIEKVIVGKQESREMVGPPPALKAKGQVAANDLPLDPDGKIRRVFITVKPEDQTIRSLGATLAGIYLNTEGIEEVDWAKKFPHLKKNDGSYLRVGNQGYEIILNYRGGAGSFTIVSLSDVLNNRLPSDW